MSGWGQRRTTQLLVRQGPCPMDGVNALGIVLIFGYKALSGLSVGDIADSQEMPDFCGQQDSTADIEVIPIHQINKAYEHMLKSDVKTASAS